MVSLYICIKVVAVVLVIFAIVCNVTEHEEAGWAFVLSLCLMGIAMLLSNGS